MTDNQEIKIEVLKTNVLQDIPGASGIAYNGEYIYIIGDNSPFLFRLSNKLEEISKTAIYSVKNLEGYQIAKRLKPDFEALELIGESKLLIFGSGSKSPERDILVQVVLNAIWEVEEVQSYDLTAFYRGIREMEVLRGAALNIEALAFHRGQLYLFNRGRNIIFVFSLDSFIQYLKSGKSFPEIEILQPNLPEIKGFKAGFSGATIDEHGNLIFTASVEDTDNPYDDGPVLGSFIGVVALSRLDVESAYQYVELKVDGQPLKVESVAVQEKTATREAVLLLTTDSDGGDSLLIKARLKW